MIIVQSITLIQLYFKKGDRTRYEHYRGKALLDVAYKVPTRIIIDKPNTYVKRRVREYQACFRSNRSIVNHIFTYTNNLLEV